MISATHYTPTTGIWSNPCTKITLDIIVYFFPYIAVFPIIIIINFFVIIIIIIIIIIIKSYADFLFSALFN